MEDPEGFVEQGGWDFLNMDKSDSEGEDEESSEGFQPSSEGAEEEESSDYSRWGVSGVFGGLGVALVQGGRGGWCRRPVGAAFVVD